MEGDCDNSVTFTGMLLGQEKIVALYRSDVFVASSYLESFGMAILEAMACCKPVVITDRVNICREVESAKAGLVTTCDPEKIADAIIELLQNPQKAQLMGKEGQGLVSNIFTWDKAAHGMIDVYKRVIRKNRDYGS